MTVEELYKNKTFLNACGLIPDAVRYISQYTYFDVHILNCTNKFFSCLYHDINVANLYKIVDYTHIPQSEINQVISAKIKYDLSDNTVLSRRGALDDFNNTYDSIFRSENTHIKFTHVENSQQVRFWVWNIFVRDFSFFVWKLVLGQAWKRIFLRLFRVMLRMFSFFS